MKEKEVLKTEEAAEFLGIKPFTVRKYAKLGIIPGKLIGRQWLFYKPDLISWLREGNMSAYDFQNKLNEEEFSESKAQNLMGIKMTKMSMIWVATAEIIHPQTAPTILKTRQEIEIKIKKLFQTTITPVMVEKHLVSWEDRQADKTNPSRGGSRNRYLFRTIDGSTPDPDGDYRLYKEKDSQYDGWDKTGKTHPDYNEVDSIYHHLIDWYINNYF